MNSENRHALWAGGLDVPPGWRVAHRAASRRECLEYIGAHWPDIRPARLPDAGKDAGACLHDLFAAQAARTPEAPALIWRDQQLTYRQLHDNASRLAAYLQQCGIGPGAFVGLCVERSPQMITALLGILKTGAAYVPRPRVPGRAAAVRPVRHGRTPAPDPAAAPPALPRRRDRLPRPAPAGHRRPAPPRPRRTAPSRCRRTPPTSSTPPAPRAAPRASW
ncbi:AMP-binding protein [Streptomyces sp. NPDC000405]|uniref:AMP-binding protein n=1 Tax=Streptomyces sp. NPDC000405 TaxID=3161033 RepID=UPI00398D600E